MTERILFLGESWLGSGGRACSSALRRMGCDVELLDFGTVFPSPRQPWLRAALRVAERAFVREYNLRILTLARQLRPDMLISFKGSHVTVGTLRMLRSMGISLYNYYPDRLYFAIGTQLAETLREYDCFFDTKIHWEPETQTQIRLRARVFVPHGYDPEVHLPAALDPRDVQEYGCDVSVLANYSAHKEEWLARLLDARPHLDLRLWGGDWEHRSKTASVRRCLRGRTVSGSRYARALGAARINLALLGVTREIKDSTTTRTFEIPAAGGFMLHERTGELSELFEDGREVATYDSPVDLAEKIEFYLAHPEERAAVAAAGHARCVPRYSYDERMKILLDWHKGRGQPSKPAGP